MGLPEVEEIDSSFQKGQYAESYKNVRKYLEKYSNFHLLIWMWIFINLL